MNRSTCGRAALIPRTSGSYPGVALRGFSHTSRCEHRARRSISASSCSGSPRSQPSERMATIDPRPIRRPCSRLSSAIASPIRVPPDQSPAASAARPRAASGSRPRELAGDPREPGAERERLAALARLDAGVRVGEQHPRVRLHRARDVAAPGPAGAGAGPACASGARAARPRGAARPGGWLAGRGATPRRATGPGPPAAPGRPAARDPGEDRPRGRPLGGPSTRRSPSSRRSSTSLAAAGRSSPGSERSSEPGAGSGTATRGRTTVATGSRSASLLALVAREQRPANAPAKRARSACSEHSAARSARYASRGSAGSTAASARCALRTSPIPTDDPAARISRPARPRTDPSERRRDSDTLRAPPAPAPAQCPRAPSAPRRWLPSRPRVVAQRHERPCPGDRLADAGELVELLAAQPCDRRADAVGDLIRDPRAAACARSPPRARGRGSRSSGRGSAA